MYSCTHWLRPRNSPHPHVGSYTRSLLVRQHLFVTPCRQSSGYIQSEKSTSVCWTEHVASFYKPIKATHCLNIAEKLQVTCQAQPHSICIHQSQTPVCLLVHCIQEPANHSQTQSVSPNHKLLFDFWYIVSCSLPITAHQSQASVCFW